MQQLQKGGIVQEFMEGDIDELQAKAKEQFESGKIDKAVIVKRPKKGDQIIINDIVFKVQQWTKNGNLILTPLGRIRKPEVS